LLKFNSQNIIIQGKYSNYYIRVWKDRIEKKGISRHNKLFWFNCIISVYIYRDTKEMTIVYKIKVDYW